MGSYGLIGETSRPRRARRLARAWKRRCSLWLFSFSLLSLVYLAFFGARLPFDSELLFKCLYLIPCCHYFPSELVFDYMYPGLHHGHVNERTFANEVEKSKMRYANDYISEDINTLLEGQDVPCEVGFAESVDNLVEPKNYLNFTKFSLECITKEEISNENVVIEPRFGGHQTLEQREKSFYARNQTIHCGFVQAPEGYRSTGFDLSEKDREYMASCIVVVSSCIFGNSDFLRRPTSSKVQTSFIVMDHSTNG
ncbi:hypothetical protein BHE74_00005914, partial [Ensete ventricosum]